MLSCLSVVVIILLCAIALFGLFVFSVLEPRRALRATLCAAAIGVVVILALTGVNLHFIQTITGPVRALTAMARRISQGSYGIQAEKPRNDEIGDLFDSINEMSAEIAQGERLQSEFISSVSHELRTPLTAITGWSETLAYDDAIQGDSRRGVAIISQEAGRLTKMVEELLEFTRIQDGRFNLDISRMDVAVVLEDVVFAYGRPLRQEGLELVYEDSCTVPPCMDGDPERLKQVFLNIIDNAAKYGRDGKKIIVDIKTEQQSVVITVRDFGRGIPAEELPHVKEKFYKGSSRERGSGIGLSVCEEIVSRHCGTLDVDNAAGGGTLVTLRLPMANKQAKE